MQTRVSFLVFLLAVGLAWVATSSPASGSAPVSHLLAPGGQTAPATAVPPPVPGVPLRTGEWTYRSVITAGDQSMTLNATTVIKEAEGGYVMRDAATTPQGEVVDEVVVDRKSLRVVRRTMTQGPMSVAYSVKDGRGTGTMAQGGQSRPFAFDAPEGLFADGAGGYQVIATLPLAPGYKTAYHNFNPISGRTASMRLEVVGAESVTVAAGAFDALKIELFAAETGARMTVWIARNDRTVVKMVAVRPDMGGTTFATELVK